jgi:hypothetical protein
MYQNKFETSRVCKVTILWNQQMQTDRTILINKLNIIIPDNKKGMFILIYVQFQETEMRLKTKVRRC